jgi:hypothetical protein
MSSGWTNSAAAADVLRVAYRPPTPGTLQGIQYMVAQVVSARKAGEFSRLSAKRVRELLLELTYRLHATRVVKRVQGLSRSGSRDAAKPG